MALNQVNAPQPKGPGKSKLDTFAEWLGPITSIAGLGTSALGAYNNMTSAAANKATEEAAKLQTKVITDQLKRAGL